MDRSCGDDGGEDDDDDGRNGGCYGKDDSGSGDGMIVLVAAVMAEVALAMRAEDGKR